MLPKRRKERESLKRKRKQGKIKMIKINNRQVKKEKKVRSSQNWMLPNFRMLKPKIMLNSDAWADGKNLSILNSQINKCKDMVQMKFKTTKFQG